MRKTLQPILQLDHMLSPHCQPGFEPREQDWSLVIEYTHWLMKDLKAYFGIYVDKK